MTTPSSEDVVIDRAEGTSFSVHWHGGPATAPAVLVVPAMGVHAGYYSKLAAALHEAGFSVAVSELRGHETSGGRRPSRGYDFGYADLVADLDMAVHAVRRRRPDAPIFLLGHSLGGHLAGVYAAHHPQAVAGLLMVATGSVWWRLWHRRMYAVGLIVNLLSAVLGYFPGHRVGLGRREARTQMRDWARFNRTGRLEFGSPRINHDQAMAEVTVPILGMSFAGDHFAPPRALAGLLAKFPRAQITRIHLGEDLTEAPGHLRWARRPEIMVEQVAGWIGRHAQA